MRSFNPAVRHVFAHEEFDGISNDCEDASLIDKSLITPKINFHRYQIYTSSLNEYFPEHFPNLAIRVASKDHISKCLEVLKDLKAVQYVKAAEYICAPKNKRKVNLAELTKLKPAPEINKFAGFAEFYEEMRKCYSISNKDEDQKALTFKDDPTIVFLGTGSMMPSTFRNVSAIGMTIHNNVNMLLDCGEGTFSQLMDIYGESGIDGYLKNLRMIFITHIHPDHNLGLFKILSERQALEYKLKLEFEVFISLTLAYFCSDAEEYYASLDQILQDSREPKIPSFGMPRSHHSEFRPRSHPSH